MTLEQELFIPRTGSSPVRMMSLAQSDCQHFDALVLPSAQVPPFPLGMEWVSSINGVPMETYIDWMTVCCAISITGLPAISVPSGFTAEGLPVGVQIVGKPHGDAALLQIAYGFEQATGWAERRPPE
jgi:amidase